MGRPASGETRVKVNLKNPLSGGTACGMHRQARLYDSTLTDIPIR